MESQAPWLSILVPVYEVERYVEACALSVLSQADEGVEIVFDVVPMRDESIRVVEELQRRHPDRVRVVSHDTNRGFAAARNDLLSAARGEYLWFVDADDLMEQGAIAGLKEIVQRHHPDLVMCDFRIFDDDGVTPPGRGPRYRYVRTFAGASGALSEDREALVRGLFTRGEFHVWSKIVRRAAWPEALRFPDGRQFEDAAVIPRLALAMRTHYHVARIWMKYRQRATSQLATAKPTHLDDRLGGLVGYKNFVKEAGLTFGDETIFRITNFIAGAYLDIAQKSVRIDGDDRHLGRYLDLLHRASPLDDRAMLKAYLRRARLGRWLRLRHWLGRGARSHDSQLQR